MKEFGTSCPNIGKVECSYFLKNSNIENDVSMSFMGAMVLSLHGNCDSRF